MCGADHRSSSTVTILATPPYLVVLKLEISYCFLVRECWRVQSPSNFRSSFFSDLATLRGVATIGAAGAVHRAQSHGGPIEP